MISKNIVNFNDYKGAHLVKSFLQALWGTSLAASEEKLLVVKSSLEAGVQAVRLGYTLKGFIDTQCIQLRNENTSKVFVFDILWCSKSHYISL